MIKSVSDVAAKIVLIEERIKEIATKLTSVSTERGRHSLAATEGDRGAAKRIDELDDNATALHRERQTLEAARDQLEQMRAEHLQAEKDKAIKAREAEARKLADEVLECCGQIDQQMAEVARLFEKRSELLRQLGSTKIVPSSYLSRLRQKFAPTCAARAAGLHGFIAIEHVPVQHVCGLRASAKALEGVLTASERSREVTDPREAA